MALKIRKMESKDLSELYELLSNRKVMRYIEPPFSLEKTKAFMDKFGLAKSPLIYSVENENGKFIGYVIYHKYDEQSKEIGWLLKESEWGKGYATELTYQLIEKAKADNMDVVLECDKNQIASKKIALKCGFIYKGNIEGLDVYRLKHNNHNLL